MSENDQNELRVFLQCGRDHHFIEPFLVRVLLKNPNRICGVGIVGNKSALRARNQPRFLYALTILIILGFDAFPLLARSIAYRLGIRSPGDSRSLKSTAARFDIPVVQTNLVSATSYIEAVEELRPDIIVNQAPAILRERFLSLAPWGVLNRHGALLPQYRGRLAPFWALLNEEKDAGVSIHYVTEKIDSGDIVVQRKWPISRFDTVPKLVRKVFEHAPAAMCEALDKIAANKGKPETILNSDEESSYYSSPRLLHAMRYRLKLLRRMLFGTR